jgi:hypothetical protein
VSAWAGSLPWVEVMRLRLRTGVPTSNRDLLVVWSLRGRLPGSPLNGTPRTRRAHVTGMVSAWPGQVLEQVSWTEVARSSLL